MTLHIRFATYSLIFNIILSVFFILLGFFVLFKKRFKNRFLYIVSIFLGFFFVFYGIFILTLYSNRRFQKLQRSASTLGIAYKIKGLIVPNVSDLKYRMPPVLDQGSLGTCVSNATSNCLRFHMKGTVFQPSRLYIHYNTIVNVEKEPARDASKDGISLDDVMTTVSEYKYCNERLWPYYWWRATTVPSQKAYKDSISRSRVTFSTVPQDLSALKEVLQSEPLIIAFDIYPSFQSFTTFMTGVVPMPRSNETTKDSHCVLLCGYDDEEKLFTIQNSWGKYAGDSGFYYMPYDYILNPQLTWGFLTLKFED